MINSLLKLSVSANKIYTYINVLTPRVIVTHFRKYGVFILFLANFSVMDIAELSRKMEANLLGTQSNESSYLKADSRENFSPRLTRSQVSKGQKCLIKEIEVKIHPNKRNLKKVDEVEKIYLNKKAKVVHKNLETIYEDPIWKKGSTMLTGTNKVKRSIYLDREFRITSKQKSKLRKMKIKRLGKKIKPFKMSDEEFKSQMLKIENYINGIDVEIEYRNENCDVEFENCDSNVNCNDLENGNIELSGSESNICENKELEIEFTPE